MIPGPIGLGHPPPDIRSNSGLTGVRRRLLPRDVIARINACRLAARP